MPSFGARSKTNLNTCHPQIQRVLNLAILKYDFSVLEGVRSKEKQEEYFASGASKVQWPVSYHNIDPDNPRDIEFPDKACAVDIVPYPIDWYNLHRFRELADIVKHIAVSEGVKLDWGPDLWGWDMPHFQLTDKTL